MEVDKLVNFYHEKQCETCKHFFVYVWERVKFQQRFPWYPSAIYQIYFNHLLVKECPKSQELYRIRKGSKTTSEKLISSVLDSLFVLSFQPSEVHNRLFAEQIVCTLSLLWRDTARTVFWGHSRYMYQPWWGPYQKTKSTSRSPTFLNPSNYKISMC